MPRLREPHNRRQLPKEEELKRIEQQKSWQAAPERNENQRLDGVLTQAQLVVNALNEGAFDRALSLSTTGNEHVLFSQTPRTRAMLRDLMSHAPDVTVAKLAGVAKLYMNGGDQFENQLDPDRWMSQGSTDRLQARLDTHVQLMISDQLAELINVVKDLAFVIQDTD